MRLSVFCKKSIKRLLNAYIATLIIAVSFRVIAVQSPEQSLTSTQSTFPILTLEKAISQAQKYDDWLEQSLLMESRFERLSVGASALPDPTISLSLMNLPTDGFALNQEPMTQIKVSASQMFPRGDSLALKEQRHQVAATEQPFLRQNRRQQVALQATILWLQAFEAAANYRLVSEAKPLFDKLGDIVSASYISSSGKADQQDIIRAELELARLNDRLIALESQKQVAVSKLYQYLYQTENKEVSDYSVTTAPTNIQFPSMLPPVTQTQNAALQQLALHSKYRLHTLLSDHPLIAANEQRIQASAIDIDIAKQNYQAQYGVSASYALRDDTPEGQSRADFFSVGVSMSVPLFSRSAHDAQVQAATLQTEAIRTEQRLLMKELIAKLHSAHADYLGLSQRASVYEEQIWPKIRQQSQASLNAYTNDTGDFSEVVRSRIEELDTQITMLNIQVKQRLALSQIDYYLSPSDQKGQASVEIKNDE